LGLQSSDDSATLVCVTSFPGEESRMTTVDFITELFYEVDEQLRTLPKHPEARLWPSEVVTLGLLQMLLVTVVACTCASVSWSMMAWSTSRTSSLCMGVSPL
jgi:hypothetical protein